MRSHPIVSPMLEAIDHDLESFDIWMMLRGWPGAWNRISVLYAREGFMRAERRKPPTATSGGEADSNDAYLLGHQLARDLRSDGPLYRIGAVLPTSAQEDHAVRLADALCWAWFIHHHAERAALGAPLPDAAELRQSLPESLHEPIGAGVSGVIDSSPPPTV
jgi:hypothetical protein